MLRIIAGELGGRRLRAPAGLSTRPTADRVRQALFNILPPPPEGAAALDLYAGSGALGIEALSRGCGRAVFVDQDPRALQTLHRNLADLGLLERGATLAQPVLRAVQRLAQLPPGAGGGPFTWVFADPPYAAAARGELDELLQLLGAHQTALLTPDATVVIEHAARDCELPVLRATHGALFRTSVRRYGDTALSFFIVTPEPQRLDDPSGAA